MLGALIFQAGVIYLGIALFRSMANIVSVTYGSDKSASRKFKSNSDQASISSVILFNVIDVVGECALGYIFIIFSRTLHKIALTPGRDVTSLATIELASIFHKFRFVLAYLCIWTAADIVMQKRISCP